MARNVSKNAQRAGEKKHFSRWGGEIRMRTIFENGKKRHFAECQETGKTARRPRELM